MTNFLTARQLRIRYDVSDMTLWRWLHDPELNFPRPTIIRRRRYWPATAVEQWEGSRAKAA